MRVEGFGETRGAQAAPVAAHFALHACRAQGFAVGGDLEAIAPAEARTLPASRLVLGVGDGGGGPARLLFGSPTARLLRAAPCPVFMHR